MDAAATATAEEAKPILLRSLRVRSRRATYAGGLRSTRGTAPASRRPVL